MQTVAACFNCGLVSTARNEVVSLSNLSMLCVTVELEQGAIMNALCMQEMSLQEKNYRMPSGKGIMQKINIYKTLIS